MIESFKIIDLRKHAINKTEAVLNISNTLTEIDRMLQERKIYGYTFLEITIRKISPHLSLIQARALSAKNCIKSILKEKTILQFKEKDTNVGDRFLPLYPYYGEFADRTIRTVIESKHETKECKNTTAGLGKDHHNLMKNELGGRPFMNLPTWEEIEPHLENLREIFDSINDKKQ